jgi:hypothetical protein
VIKLEAWWPNLQEFVIVVLLIPHFAISAQGKGAGCVLDCLGVCKPHDFMFILSLFIIHVVFFMVYDVPSVWIQIHETNPDQKSNLVEKTKRTGRFACKPVGLVRQTGRFVSKPDGLWDRRKEEKRLLGNRSVCQKPVGLPMN